MLANHPAKAATEGIAEYANVGRRTGEIGKGVLAGGDGKRLRQHACLDAGATRGRVDLDAAHPLPFDEQRVTLPIDRAGVVAAGIERDTKAVVGGVLDDRDYVVGGLWVGDCDRPLVDRKIPRLARSIPGFIVRPDDAAAQVVAEATQVHLSGD